MDIMKSFKHADDALREHYEIRRRDHIPLPVSFDSEHPRKQKGFKWKDYLEELEYVDSPQFLKERREKSDEIRDRMECYIKEEAVTHTTWNFFMDKIKVFVHSIFDVWITRSPLIQIIILLVILNYYTLIGIVLFLITDCTLVFLFSHFCFVDMICAQVKNFCFCHGCCSQFLERRKITKKETTKAKGWCCRYRSKPYHESVFEYALDFEYSNETWKSSDVICYYATENMSLNVTQNETSTWKEFMLSSRIFQHQDAISFLNDGAVKTYDPRKALIHLIPKYKHHQLYRGDPFNDLYKTFENLMETRITCLLPTNVSRLCLVIDPCERSRRCAFGCRVHHPVIQWKSKVVLKEKRLWKKD